MTTKLKNRLLSIAQELKHIPQSSYSHFTFLLDKNKILSMGSNDNFSSHPISAKFNYFRGSRHSEIDAYVRLKYKEVLPYLTMINIRLSKTGIIGMSHPCEKCMHFLSGVGMPRKVFYSNSFGEFERGF